jgi:hypothetical protein
MALSGSFGMAIEAMSAPVSASMIFAVMSPLLVVTISFEFGTGTTAWRRFPAAKLGVTLPLAASIVSTLEPCAT